MADDIPVMTTFTDVELEQLLQRAAEKGAQKALADVGLDGQYAEHDIRDLRTLLRSINIAKKTAWQTLIRVVTTSLLVAIMAGIATAYQSTSLVPRTRTTHSELLMAPATTCEMDGGGGEPLSDPSVDVCNQFTLTVKKIEYTLTRKIF